MTGPIDAVVAIHNAFRQDMKLIDAAALDSARGKPGLAATVERFRLLQRGAGVARARRGARDLPGPRRRRARRSPRPTRRTTERLDAAFDALSNAVSARDRLETARATEAFKFYLDIHLNKEDTHLYRLIKERVSVPDQGRRSGSWRAPFRQDRFPELVAWMFPLMGNDDRENMTRIWQMVMPADAFAGATQLVEKAIGDDWSELARRIPELAGAH